MHGTAGIVGGTGVAGPRPAADSRELLKVHIPFVDVSFDAVDDHIVVQHLLTE